MLCYVLGVIFVSHYIDFLFDFFGVFDFILEILYFRVQDVSTVNLYLLEILSTRYSVCHVETSVTATQRYVCTMW